MKIALIGTDYSTSEERKKTNGYGGVTYYRLIAPMLNLKEHEFTYHGADLIKEAEGKTTEKFWDDFIKRYDMFVVKHIDNAEAASNLIFFCQRYRKPLILDLDDNLFEIKSDQPAYELYKPGSEKRAIVSALLSFVDGLFVSTQPLADYYEKYLKDTYGIKKPIFVLPNYNEKEIWNFKPVEKNPNKITVGWMGSTTHYNDLKIVLPAMQRLLKEYPNLEFCLMGGVSHEDAPQFFEGFDDSVLDRVYVAGGTTNFAEYPKALSEQVFDIGIAPLTNDEFNRGKSWIKWMEYACYGIPCIASKVNPYFRKSLGQDAIVDGKTGFIATDKQWYEKIKRLIDDKDLRETIGKQAQEYVFNELQYKDHQHLWVEALSKFI